MKAKNQTTVVGVFEDRFQANKAVEDLKKAGFRDDQIGLAMRHDDSSSTEVSDEQDSQAGSGAIAGALTGLGLGALAGLGVLAGVIPVIGPAITAGTLGIVLTNAAAGAGIAGLVGALVGSGIPEHEAEYYKGEFEAGRCIVTVNANGRAAEATTIMRGYGAYDMSTRDSASSVVGSTESSASASLPTRATARTGKAGDTIEVKEERLHAQKKSVEAGEVRIRKDVHTETKTIEVPVEHEEIVIERTPVNRKASTSGISSSDLAAGEEIRIPVREERVSVTKDAVVTEEVKVGKKVVQGTEKVSGQVRKEEVHVEQAGDVDVRSRGKKSS